MARTIYLEKTEAPAAGVYFAEGALRAFWRGVAEGGSLAITSGIVGKGSKPAQVKTFESEALAVEALERAAAAQVSRGFVKTADPSAPKKARAKLASPLELRFHRRLFASLGVEPVLSTPAEKQLAAREAACGVRFPASVRELFTIKGVHALFRENTNHDELVPLSELGVPAELRAGFLRIATENQAVVAWYVKLDGTDDPPVVHNDDHFDVPLAEVPWVACADRFSEFLREVMLG